MTCEPADRLLQSLLVHAPGTTEAIVKLEMFNVMDEFFRRTSAWRHEAEITLEETITEYSLYLPADAAFVRMMGVSLNNTPVPAAPQPGSSQTSVGRITPEQTFADGDAAFAPNYSDISGGLFTYAIYQPSYITISAPPTSEQLKYPLLAVMALSVARSCLDSDCGDWEIPEWMFDMFFQDFYDGTLGKLYAMPSKPWSSKELTNYHGKRFRNAMALRKQEANRGFVYNRPAFRFPKVGGWV
jgi:hypothetical protein